MTSATVQRAINVVRYFLFEIRSVRYEDFYVLFFESGALDGLDQCMGACDGADTSAPDGSTARAPTGADPGPGHARLRQGEGFTGWGNPFAKG